MQEMQLALNPTKSTVRADWSVRFFKLNSHLQAKQLAELISSGGTGFECLLLDVRDVEEHTLCHIKGGKTSPFCEP